MIPHMVAGAYPCLQASFILRRSLGYYVTRLYAPSGLAVLAAWLALWLDVRQAGARLLLGLVCSLLPPLLALHAAADLPTVAYITVRALEQKQLNSSQH